LPDSSRLLGVDKLSLHAKHGSHMRAAFERANRSAFLEAHSKTASARAFQSIPAGFWCFGILAMAFKASSRDAPISVASMIHTLINAE
jgi:hypothetical protein